MLEFIILFAVLLLVGIAGIYVVGDPYQYCLTEIGISIKFKWLFTVELYFFRYSNIEKLELIPIWKANLLILFPFLRVGFRWWGRQAILVRMKSGSIRVLILTPPEVVSFAE